MSDHPRQEERQKDSNHSLHRASSTKDLPHLKHQVFSTHRLNHSKHRVFSTKGWNLARLETNHCSLQGYVKRVMTLKMEPPKMALEPALESALEVVS